MNNELDEMVESRQNSFFELVKPKAAEAESRQPQTSRSSEKRSEELKENKRGGDEADEDSDTDSEAELATGVRTKKKRQHFTNDELFYDPDADEQDAKWASEKRSSSRKQKLGSELVPKKSILKKPTTSQTATNSSDAVLNCPCCMTMLTMDCQR